MGKGFWKASGIRPAKINSSNRRTPPPPRKLALLTKWTWRHSPFKGMVVWHLQRISRWKFCIDCKSTLAKTGVAEIRRLFQMKGRKLISSNLPWVPEIFSRVWRGASSAAGPHVFGLRRVTFKTWPKSETAHEKSLAPRVHQIKHAYFILKMDKWWLMALKRAPNKPPKKQQQQQWKLILYILK